MPLYVPDEVLPIYPTFTTVIKDGIKYKAYFETDWHQVMTEDGVPLCDLLQSMPSFSSNNFYRYCGTFKTTPSSSGIDQLYALTEQHVGDVYLVETELIVDDVRVCESYVWLGNEQGWVYCGTTNRKATISRYLPECIKLFPDTMGEPDQALIVGKDGKSIAWGNIDTTKIDSHNIDPTSHADIRESLNLKSDKLIIYNDTVRSSDWVYNGDFPCFEYMYTSDRLPVGSYFEISPVIESQEDSQNITNAAVSGVYKIHASENQVPYGILRAKRVPNTDIEICVKVFGTYNEK